MAIKFWLIFGIFWSILIHSWEHYILVHFLSTYWAALREGWRSVQRVRRGQSKWRPWGRFYKTVSAEIYGWKINLDKFRLEIYALVFQIRIIAHNPRINFSGCLLGGYFSKIWGWKLIQKVFFPAEMGLRRIGPRSAASSARSWTCWTATTRTCGQCYKSDWRPVLHNWLAARVTRSQSNDFRIYNYNASVVVG
jgi:hypothetical protein